MIKTMDRRASDNKYLHRDFHVSCDIGLNYIAEKYGKEAVKEYIYQFVDNYHSILSEKLKMF